MYDKYLETNKEAKQAHDKALKDAAAKRLAVVASKKKAKKKQEIPNE